MPKKSEEKLASVVDDSVGVRSPDGKESKVCSQTVADSLCEKHGFVDIAKEKAAKKAAEKAAETE